MGHDSGIPACGNRKDPDDFRFVLLSGRQRRLQRQLNSFVTGLRLRRFDPYRNRPAPVVTNLDVPLPVTDFSAGRAIHNAGQIRQVIADYMDKRIGPKGNHFFVCGQRKVPFACIGAFVQENRLPGLHVPGNRIFYSGLKEDL